MDCSSSSSSSSRIVVVVVVVVVVGVGGNWASWSWIGFRQMGFDHGGHGVNAGFQTLDSGSGLVSVLMGPKVTA